MDLNIRLILMSVGAIIIALIIADGVRRIRRQQKLNSEATQSYDEADDPLFSSRTESAVVIKSHQERVEPVLGGAADDQIISATSIVHHQNLPAVVIFNVMACDNTQFDGPNVLQALLSLGLRHGDMNIFHRHEAGQRQPIFSVASAVEPGTFDLDAMGSFLTPGLSLFFAPPDVEQPAQVFEQLLECAEKLADRLGGELKDARHDVLTEETLSDLRQQLSPVVSSPNEQR